MDKKAGISISLKFIIGLIIAIMAIWVLLTVVNKFIIWGTGKTNQQENFFNELNQKIQDSSTNQEITQLFELQNNYLVIAFNNKDTEVNLKDIEIYTGRKEDIKTTIKKPIECIKNCLCLCKTKSKKLLFEDDCYINLCQDYKEEIYNNDHPFFIFKEGTTTLKIKKTTDKINISF